VYFRGEVSRLNPKKFFLYLLIASVAVSALVGIGVFLFGNFGGEFEMKVLLTTMTVTVTSILGLACGASLEAGRGKILPLIGIVLTVISAVLWLQVVWGGMAETDFPAKLLLSTTLLAAACSHLSLLSIARLDRKFHWTLYAAHLAVWTLVAIWQYSIWRNFENVGDSLSRVIGILLIVIAAITILTPILHRLSNQTQKSEEIDAEIERLKRRIEELERQKAEMRESYEE
jgi:hypothetical protein